MDRFIVWAERKPTPADLDTFLADYFAGAATFQKKHGRVFVRLPGEASNPFKRLVVGFTLPEPIRPERWIEVVLTDTSADVITRLQDEYTNALADGLAVAMERFWQADWRNQE